MNAVDQEQKPVVLTREDLEARMRSACQAEREAYQRDDLTSAWFWADRYEELEARYWDLVLIEHD